MEDHPIPDRPAPGRRPWPVTALAGLFVLQALGLAALGTLLLVYESLAWEIEILNFNFHPSRTSEAALFYLLGAFLLPASLGFIRRWSFAWSYASFMQGLILFVALVMYFGTRPIYVYPMMAFSIFLVVYLHQDDVQQTFRQLQADPTLLTNSSVLEVPPWED